MQRAYKEPKFGQWNTHLGTILSLILNNFLKGLAERLVCRVCNKSHFGVLQPLTKPDLAVSRKAAGRLISREAPVTTPLALIVNPNNARSKN